VAVTHDQAVAVLVALVGERGDVGVDLGFQGLGQHPAGALADNLVDQRCLAVDRPVVVTGCGVRDYGEHGRAFPNQRANAGLIRTSDLSDHPREGAPTHITSPETIHRF